VLLLLLIVLLLFHYCTVLYCTGAIAFDDAVAEVVAKSFKDINTRAFCVLSLMPCTPPCWGGSKKRPWGLQSQAPTKSGFSQNSVARIKTVQASVKTTWKRHANCVLWGSITPARISEAMH
jgi:hypothetical protein